MERNTKKRNRLQEDEEEEDEDDLSSAQEESEQQDSEEEEIIDLNAEKHSKKPKKRRRALSPTAFGTSLSALLQAPEPSAAAIAHLHAQASRKSEKETKDIEAKALKFLQATKHEQQERGHVTDVIGGWTARPAKPFSQWSNYQDDVDQDEERTLGGAEAEKVLRKLAQRGVVKLFNAIRAAQGTSEEITTQTVKSDSVRRKAIKTITEAPSPSSDLVSTTLKSSQDFPIRTEDLPAEKRLPNILGSKGKEQACQ